MQPVFFVGNGSVSGAFGVRRGPGEPKLSEKAGAIFICPSSLKSAQRHAKGDASAEASHRQGGEPMPGACSAEMARLKHRLPLVGALGKNYEPDLDP